MASRRPLVREPVAPNWLSPRAAAGEDGARKLFGRGAAVNLPLMSGMRCSRRSHGLALLYPGRPLKSHSITHLMLPASLTMQSASQSYGSTSVGTSLPISA